ncbi:MAG: exo-alpha-sialidase [Anaerolineae bacterium]|nr:exo-alpha-sialidase [Anaerolineae bacterium]
MEHVIIYRNDRSYSAFPDLVLLDDARIKVVFREADLGKDLLGRGYDHLDKSSRIASLVSADGGRTWTGHRVLYNSDDCGEQDPSIARLRDGRLLINFFRWRVVPPEQKDRLFYPALQLKNGYWADFEGPFVIASSDGGATWDTEPLAVDPAPLPRAGCSDAVLELEDGTLLLPAYGGDPGSTFSRAYVIRSRDGGCTWGAPAIIARHPEERLSFEEPALCNLGGGRLLAVMRSGVYRVGYEYLYRAFSDDAGLTWHSLEQTPMWGHPAHLLRLSDGRILCTYGYRREPFGVRACLSADAGRTWDIAHEIVLRSDGADRDLGYPSSVQLPGGDIFTAYYFNQGDTRYIVGTRWRLAVGV